MTKISLAAACREALTKLGTEADAGQVKEWIGANYPTTDTTTTSFNSTLSIQRSALRKKDNPGNQGQDEKPVTVEPRKKVEQEENEQTKEVRLFHHGRQTYEIVKLRTALATLSALRRLAKEVGGFEMLKIYFEQLEAEEQAEKQAELDSYK